MRQIKDISAVRSERTRYKREYRKRKREIILIYSKEDAELLQQEAQGKGLSVPAYIKQGVKALQSGTNYILPKESRLAELILEIRKVTNKVNEIVRHSSTDSLHVDIQKMQEYLAIMEEKIIIALSRPPSLEAVLEEQIRTNPEYKDQLINFLQSLP